MTQNTYNRSVSEPKGVATIFGFEADKWLPSLYVGASSLLIFLND